MKKNASYIGEIQDISDVTIRATLADHVLTGLTYINGVAYKIGQIGSFVKIPMGYIDLFGIVTQVGASAVPENQAMSQPYGNKWLILQLIGEGSRQNNSFKIGVSQYPTIGDELHIVSQTDLSKIYGQPNTNNFVDIGHIIGADSIPALIDINKLIVRHSAIVGTTGSGKSTTVANLLRILSDNTKYPSARMILFDLHGEYAKALGDKATVYKINSEKSSKNERELCVPFWALSFEELCEVSFGKFNSEKDKYAILEEILKAKRNTVINHQEYYGAEFKCTVDNISVDSPIPFNLHQLWYDLLLKNTGTYYPGRSKNGEIVYAFELDSNNQELRGDCKRGIAPTFKRVNMTAGEEKINYLPPNTLNISQQLQTLGTKLRISRYDFLFKPNGWTVNENDKTDNSISELLINLIGNEKSITLLDLSGVPTDIINIIIGALLRIVYDALFWARNLIEGGRRRPLLVVMEEAHNYLNKDSIASHMVQKIVKEGRKYGIGSMIVSQRPSEINPTILSQCGTFFALRLTNSNDRNHVVSLLPDNLSALTNLLPILQTGEAIIVGESVKIPMRTLINALDERPDSEDPLIWQDDNLQNDFGTKPGWGWRTKPKDNLENAYKNIAKAWLLQNPDIKTIKREEINTEKEI